MSRSGILCGPAWCIDRNIAIATWPQEETVVVVLAEDNQGGCPGHNMSTALKRLGVPFPVSAFGLVGDDADGHRLAEICDETGIDRAMLELRQGLITSNVMAVTARDTGKRTFFSTAGAHAAQTPDDFDFSKSTARYVHLGLPGFHEKLDGPWKDDPSGWVTLIKNASAAGLKANLEMASFDAKLINTIVVPMMPWLNSLIINDFEAAAISGVVTIENGQTNVAACRAVLEQIMQTHSNLDFAAIHFPQGAIAALRNCEIIEQPSVNVPQSAIVSSNGAGDCFAAGVLFGRHEGWPMQEGLKLGHAAAAASLRAAGTTTAVMPWKDCLALASQWGWR